MNKELKLAMQDEAYHRKQMEYYQEKIKIIRKECSIDSYKKGKDAIKRLRCRN